MNTFPKVSATSKRIQSKFFGGIHMFNLFFSEWTFPTDLLACWVSFSWEWPCYLGCGGKITPVRVATNVHSWQRWRGVKMTGVAWECVRMRLGVPRKLKTGVEIQPTSIENCFTDFHENSKSDRHTGYKETFQYETSRERPKSAPYPRLKNSKRTSKFPSIGELGLLL